MVPVVGWGQMTRSPGWTVARGMWRQRLSIVPVKPPFAGSYGPGKLGFGACAHA